jgi:hypothetical protein
MIPPQISSTGSSSCLCSVSSTCTLYNSSAFLININSPVAVAGTSFIITLNNILNPPTTTPTSTFALTTYYYNTSTPTDVLSASVVLTATAVNLYSAAVTTSSSTVLANSTYTVDFKNKNALPVGSYIVISFPSDFIDSVGASLRSFIISNISQSGCTMTILSTMKFQFNSCITSTIAAQTSFSIILGNIINPSSTKPTASLSI